jgi:hypothetical protein
MRVKHAETAEELALWTANIERERIFRQLWPPSDVLEQRLATARSQAQVHALLTSYLRRALVK